jgi:hypothetical protein
MLKRRSPAIEKVPMISTRMSQTMIATKTGIALVMVAWLTRLLPTTVWLITATEIPHQVRPAFMEAASSQAPNKYHTSAGSSRPCSGVNRRAIPAKSIPQKAIERIVAQRTPANFRSRPSRKVKLKTLENRKSSGRV